jgi:hydroxymethylpyrimidine pyrophosphatase-like HAD family hydrolase
MKYKTICVDFDGVLCDHSRGWEGRGVFRGAIPGASKYMRKLKDAGWTIIIFTTRNEKKEIKAFLDLHDIPFDYINENPQTPKGANQGKPIASVYLDDRGVCFKGNWKKAFSTITNFSPWQNQPANLPDEELSE